MNRLLTIFLILLVLTISTGIVFAGEVKVIANNSVGETSVSKNLIANIYQGKISSWSDGSAVVAIMIKSGESRTDFLANYVSKSDGDFNALWMQNIFAGKGTPPETVNNAEEMVKKVSETPGAIGFVPAGTAIANLKVLTVN